MYILTLTLRGFRVTTVGVKKTNNYYIFQVYVYSRIYPADKAHAPYYIVICGLSVYTILFHVTSSMARFLEKCIGHKICYDFLYKFSSKYFSF
jgi:hypothetical protein